MTDRQADYELWWIYRNRDYAQLITRPNAEPCVTAKRDEPQTRLVSKRSTNYTGMVSPWFHGNSRSSSWSAYVEAIPRP
jgi:hypothetical protein